MNLIIFTLVTITIIYSLNSFLKKIRLLKNYSGQVHQKFLGNKEIPLNDLSLLFCLFILIIFLIGFASDVNYLSSPSLRFLLQSLSLLIFIFIFKIEVTPTRIYFLDLILNNLILSYLFTAFCLMIVVNGTNFIDGINSLVILYYLAIYIIIFYFGFNFELGINNEKINYILIFLIIMSIFNLNNQLYLGDSGSYVIAFITSVFLIDIYRFNQGISPFFIVLLLWYPCFENLFSIIRKFKIKRSPILADNKHLHQLLFNYLQKKTNLKKIYTNNLTSLIILSYNFLIFFLACKNIYNTQYQITLLLLNIFIYTFIYVRLFNYFFKINSK